MNHSFRLPVAGWVLSSILLTSVPSARAEKSEEYPAKRVAVTASKKIKGLEWGPPELQAKAEKDKTGRNQVSVLLKGTFKRTKTNLLIGKQIIPLRPDQAFETWVPVQSSDTFVDVTSVDARGNAEAEKIQIQFPSYKTFAAGTSQNPAAFKKFRFFPAIGPTYLSYTQTDIPSASGLAVTAKVSLIYSFLPSRWDIGASAFISALPLKGGLPDTTIRFLGVNLRGGYALPFLPEPWRLSLLVGAYYTTTFVTGNAYGFKNMAGPQIFPSIRRRLGNGGAISGYVKFSPVSDRFNFLELSSREIATGATWSIPMSGGKAFTLSVDLANIQIQSAQTVIKTTSASLSAGLAL